MINKLFYTSIFATILIFSSCQKDKLEGELDEFEGRYTWKFTAASEDWWNNNVSIYQASKWDYTAEVEFTNKGKIIFYIDGDEIHKTGFSIEDSHTSEDGKTYLEVNPFKEDSKVIDLNDKINFSLRNDTLTINDFPGDSYDADAHGTHYFIRN